MYAVETLYPCNRGPDRSRMCIRNCCSSASKACWSRLNVVASSGHGHVHSWFLPPGPMESIPVQFIWTLVVAIDIKFLVLLVSQRRPSAPYSGSASWDLPMCYLLDTLSDGTRWCYSQWENQSIDIGKGFTISLPSRLLYWNDPASILMNIQLVMPPKTISRGIYFPIPHISPHDLSHWHLFPNCTFMLFYVTSGNYCDLKTNDFHCLQSKSSSAVYILVHGREILWVCSTTKSSWLIRIGRLETCPGSSWIIRRC